MEKDAEAAIVYLMKAVYKLMIKTDVQAAALSALARMHPSPDQVGKNFLTLIEHFHETHDATQEGDEFHPYMTTEVDTFLAALDKIPS